MADPLSVSASVVGLIAAGAKLVSLIVRINDPPQVLTEVRSELISLKVVIDNLRTFVERSRSINATRISLVPLQDVILVFTQIVLVHSELEAFVRSRSSSSKLNQKLRGALGRDVRVGDCLLNQLQRHKASLSLILSIVNWYILAQDILMIAY